MSLDRQHIIDGGLAILREHGLAALSMRRLAGDLGVQAGAIYWHVASKQELLAALAEQILAPVPAGPDRGSGRGGPDPRQAACDIRTALLAVRDGAEVVSFAYALTRDGLAPIRRLRELFTATLAPEQAEWAAATLTYYILGAVAEEQNRAELVRAKILPDEQRGDGLEAFLFGVDAIVAGVETLGARR